ncbi:MAG: MFS transporter, partial [Anaerovoracaceae bacterium]
MMVSGAFIIFFTGYPHVWSIYQPYVMEQAGWTQSQASLCFYLALALFVFGNIVGGRLQDRTNPRIVVMIGGAVFTAGIILSSFLIIPFPVPMYLTYGVMQGFGQGMIYTVIISTAQKWFPGRTGFASGIVVTANGLCGLFLAPVSRTLLEKTGPSGTLLVIGIAIGIAWILCSLFFFVPDEQWRRQTEEEIARKSGTKAVVSQKQYTSGEMIRTKSFYYLLATMLFGLISYFLISPVSQTYQISLGIPASVAVSAVMIGSIANAATRLVLPTLADKVGRSVCIKVVLLVSIAAMTVLALTDSWTVTAAIIIMYGCYGGIMGSFPSFTTSIFGIAHSGENYGYVMLGIVIATFGAPSLTGYITGKGMPMQTVFAAGMLMAVFALISLGCLERELKNEEHAD